MAGNDTISHICRPPRRCHLFKRRTQLPETVCSIPTTLHFKQPTIFLLLTFLTLQASFELCYTIRPHSTAATNHPSQNSASSQQHQHQRFPSGISETPRSQLDDDKGNYHAVASEGSQLQRTPVSRTVDKQRDSESETNSGSQPSDNLDESESASSDDAGNDETTGSGSTSGTTDDYNATLASSSASPDETDASDASDIDASDPSAAEPASERRPVGAGQRQQASAPLRRSEAMMDLVRTPQLINVPSAAGQTSGNSNHAASLNKQRQAAPANMAMQQLPPAAAGLAVHGRRESTGAGATTMSSLMRPPQLRPSQLPGQQAGAQMQSTTSGGPMRELAPTHQHHQHQQQHQHQHQLQHQHQQNNQRLQPEASSHHQFATISTTPTTTTTTSASVPTNRLLANEQMPVAAFNLNMGADRMLIKPHHQLRADTVESPMSTRSSIMNQQEIGTESVNHELLMSQPVPINDRRHSDLLYPSSSIGNKVTLLDQTNSDNNGGNSIAMRHSIESSFASRTPPSILAAEQEQELASQVSMPSICYTPLALLMVIVVTMMTTILVCFCTHVLIKHLGRHRFDLIESSRQLNTKYGCGQLQGAPANRPTSILAPIETGALATGQQRDGNKTHSFMLNLFQNDHSLQQHQLQNNDTGQKNAQRLCDEHGFAFDNPYFRDETGLPTDRHAAYLQLQHQHQQRQQQQLHKQQVQNRQNQQVGLLTTQNDQQAQRNDPARDQLHFIEHHISNLHNRQVTSSVKELSILGSPNAAAHVVDLTSDEQRAKVLADPKEGDLVSVDITGHDIIGLGFDVYGDQQEGIFIKSVQTRGPARESGCIQAGDRIKCINISFENMTLQDACDILNCGSPYKMRLLLEKRFASGSLSKADSKLARSNGSQNQAIMLRQNYPPAIMTARKPTPVLSLSNQRPATERTASRITGGASNGFFQVTRQCVKRLTSLVSGGHSRSGDRSNALEPYRDQFNTGFRMSSDQQLFEPTHCLGSAAARRQHFALAASNTANATGYARDERQHSELHDFEQTAARALSPLGNGQSTGHINRSQSGSINSNQRDRYLANDDDDNEGFVNNDDFGLDNSSLDFNNRNTNHRLHGPPLFDGQQNQVGGRREAVDLHLAANESMNPLSAPGKQVSSSGIGARRQSAADVAGQLKSSGLNKRPNAVLQHLEQSQSQPEIAHNSTSRDDDDAGNDNQSLAAQSDADCGSIDLPTNSKGRPLSDLLAGQPLVGSVSTPTMNLLSNNTNKQSIYSADWQRKSSKRRRDAALVNLQKQKKENSIREEPTSDSSFADSTSKLVGAGREEFNKKSDVAGGGGTKSTSTDSAVAVEQFPSSTISSKNSTGTHITCLEPRINIKKSIKELNMRASAANVDPSQPTNGTTKQVADHVRKDTKYD